MRPIIGNLFTAVLLCLLIAVDCTPVSAAPVDSGITLGVFPRRPAPQTAQMFAPLAAWLSTRLGEPVRLETPPDFTTFWDGIRSGRYQLVHYNAYHYVRSHLQFGHRAIAMNEEAGSAQISSAIWVRSDSGIGKAADLRHRRIVFGGGQDAMVSYIMAVDLLQSAGLPRSDFITRFTITPAHALMAVYYYNSAAAGLAANALEGPSSNDQLDTSRLKRMLVSQPVAQHPWALSADVSPALGERIRTALLGMDQTPEGREALGQAGLTALVAASDHDYDPHRAIIERVLGERY